MACKEWVPADYEFYIGKTYYYETPINPVVKSAAGIITRFALWIMRDMGPGTVKWPAPENRQVGE